MRRLLALVAAAAMVAGSIAVRSRLDRREEDRTNPVRIVCARELGKVCDELRETAAALTVEPAGSTADRLAAATEDEPGVDGWLVPAPWPQIVDGRRRQRSLVPLFSDVGAPLARSPLVLVLQRGLVDRLRPRCNGPVEWRCLGDQAGDAKPGHADPGSDAIGALVVAQAVAAFFGRAADLSSFDLENDDFARWFRALERATPPTLSGGSPLDEMLGTNFAAYNAVGTIEADAAPIVAAPAVQERVVLLYPAPMATADVVLASRGGEATRRARDVAGGPAVRRALAEAGWRVEGAPGPSQPALPPGNGLPSPGLVDTLRERASEVRR